MKGDLSISGQVVKSFFHNTCSKWQILCFLWIGSRRSAIFLLYQEFTTNSYSHSWLESWGSHVGIASWMTSFTTDCLGEFVTSKFTQCSVKAMYLPCKCLLAKRFRYNFFSIKVKRDNQKNIYFMLGSKNVPFIRARKNIRPSPYQSHPLLRSYLT